MHARNLSQGIERIAPKSSRRTLVKQALALGTVAVANGTLAGTVLGRAAATPSSAVIPVEAPVIAEWKVNSPSGVFVGFGSVWVLGHDDLTTTRIDPATNNVVAVIEGTGNHADGALAVGDVMWVIGQSDDTIWIDPVTNTVSTTMQPVPGAHHGMAYGSDSLRIITQDNHLDRIDPATGEIIASIRYAPGYSDITCGVVFKADAAWVLREDGQELIKVDAATNSVVPKTPYATLIDQANAQPTVPKGKGTDSLWLRTGPDATPALLRVDPVTGVGLAVLPLTEDQFFGGRAATDEFVWLAGQEGLMSRVNVATNQIDGAYDTGPGTIYSIAIGFGSVWLRKYDLNLIQRLDIAP